MIFKFYLEISQGGSVYTKEIENLENEGIIVNGKVIYRYHDTSLRGQCHVLMLTMFQGWDSVLFECEMPWICAQQNLDLIWLWRP